MAVVRGISTHPEPGPEQDDGGSSESDSLHGGKFLDRDSKADAAKVQKRGCESESRRIGKTRSVGGHFRTMGVSVEDGKERDEGDAGGQGHSHGTGNEHAQQHNGKQDAGFDKGKVDAGHAENAAQGHDRDKRQRNSPEGASAHLRGPESDG